MPPDGSGVGPVRGNLGTGRREVSVVIDTEVGAANAQRIVVRDFDLAEDLIGKVTYTEMVLLAVTGRIPSSAEARLADAVLVSLVDHGLQPSALAARMTYHVGPEALQGAVAAGVLGAGSLILGTMENCARLLAEIQASIDSGTATGESVDAHVRALLDSGHRIPGVGHALHRDGDPRAASLIAVATEEGIATREIEHLKAVAAVAETRTGRRLPLNGAGVAAAILLGLEIPWQLHRGFAIISRTGGLVAHIGEEIDQPITPAIRSALRKASWLEET